ncbi:GNAT family N-acetyltransferase [Gryllotalpicola daejeonensis]|uniref:GNAT family N-acetyltransferase n=1 Tax=Gryllotalpicola daejeonensis TaxID=993087 RepID=A0ABP7ZE41_9MICO
MPTEPEDATDRLDLFRPTLDDVEQLHEILSDPRVWQHFPSLRPTEPAQTAARVRGWMLGWRAVGLDTWVVRERGSDAIIGYGGCSVLPGGVWNLGYRLAPASQGRGFATELSRRAIERAERLRPELPVVAYLLEHNLASKAVAEKLGMTPVHRGPDAGNPDPRAIRLVYAFRPLTAGELAAALH